MHRVCDPLKYFVLATPRNVTATEAARVQPDHPQRPAHDAFTRLLHRLEPDPSTLWDEVRPLVRRGAGVLLIDDSTLHKPYAEKIELVTQHWSGKHRSVVWGINLISLVWTDSDRLYPVDYRIYDKARDGYSKNDHGRDLLLTAKNRGFTPECVLFDRWYASLDNLKQVRALGWRFLTVLKANRLVNQDRTRNRPLSDWPIAEAGTVVHLRGFGFVKVFRIVRGNGDVEYWATNDLEMTELERPQYAERAWAIEEFHRGIKQHCGVERAQVWAARAQRNHSGVAIRAFVRREYHRFTTGISWAEAKLQLIRDALRHYLG